MTDNQCDTHLTKQIRKVVNKIERILVPTDSTVHSTIGERLEILMKKVQRGAFYENADATVKTFLTGRKIVKTNIHAQTLSATFADRFVKANHET